MYSEVLGVECGPRDDFFELGGDSMAALELAAAVDEFFGVELEMSALLEAPTPALLADRLVRRRPRDASPLFELRTPGEGASEEGGPASGVPVVCVAGGGGHARYTTAFCRKHPLLAGTVLDLAGALAAGARTVDDAGLRDRITLREWDITSAEPITGGPCDVALLFNIVHGFSPEENLALLRRVAACTAEGGTVALIEPLEADDADGTSSARAFVRLFSLNLFHGQGGRTYSFEEIAGWLNAAGFTDVRRSALTRVIPAT